MNPYPTTSWPATPFTFSVLVDSPIRCNLPFSPVSALVFPLAKADIFFSSLIVIALDILMAFLFKRSLVHPPLPRPPAPGLPQQPICLTLPQLAELIQAADRGRVPLWAEACPSMSPSGSAYAYKNAQRPGQGRGPVGDDEPLFPDNLSVSLFVSAPFAFFDASPDTAFFVPLFEIPGAPGNLIIGLGLFIAQFFIERAGMGTPGCQPNGNGGSPHAAGTLR